ncbi:MULTISPECIES: MFS transporter [unclassified Bacillus (in: firmicutes)]|uniref:MFS transporter n=1 Tax=unclassified Bacillus (in: firmicutes) TaxID=185979 RepID=UPI0008EA89BF|nr:MULTISPECIES: MFS transporter [unclassified Bacillus (in: firmicutes)]SFB08890.1 Predicted arabinose efflux permease, MFS family [Bacillus sp. UNCCL13]SFQ86914.1 Predicted arabinose efflux permease, MFS family [Bacillus sp. cl95]
MNKQSSLRFWILVGIVAISGFSQGMLLPLIAIIFEQDGLSSSMNGFHATGLYLGILLVSPLMEAPLRRFGYKPIILWGGLAVALSLALFPLWKSFWFWFLLRLIIGIGDHMLHFGTQTWITSFSPGDKRGRNISLYGLFFGIGFAAGPILTSLVSVSESLPFMISAAISLVAWGAIWFLQNEKPEQFIQTSSFLGTFQRFGQVWKYAWVSLLPPFGYGFLETSLNGNFPVYALRSGIDISAVSILLPAFAGGAIIFQLPLGIMSDRFGRKPVLMAVMLSGFIAFTAAGMLEQSVLGLFICFFIAGMLVGSTFSLGISYMADLLPKQLLPAGNLMCGIFFSFGSITGPFIGGLVIQYFQGGSFFYVISMIMFAIFIALVTFKPVHSTSGKKEAF